MSSCAPPKRSMMGTGRGDVAVRGAGRVDEGVPSWFWFGTRFFRSRAVGRGMSIVVVRIRSRWRCCSIAALAGLGLVEVDARAAPLAVAAPACSLKTTGASLRALEAACDSQSTLAKAR